MGKLVSSNLELPISGALCGLFLLFVCQFFSLPFANWLKRASPFILNNMTLFFIPALLGSMAYYALISQHWLALFAAIGISTILSLGACAYAAKLALLKRKQHGKVG